MTKKAAHEAACTWSRSVFEGKIPPSRVAVVRARPAELHRGFYHETWTPTIPTEQIVAIYFNGRIETQEVQL